MRESTVRALFIEGMALNIVLVALTVVAYWRGWHQGAYWAIFLTWAVVTAGLVVVAFFGRSTRPALEPLGGPSHE